MCFNQLPGAWVNIDIDDNNYYNDKTRKAAAASTEKELTH